MIRTSLLAKYRPNSKLIKLVTTCNCESTWLKVSICFTVPGPVTAKKRYSKVSQSSKFLMCSAYKQHKNSGILSIISYEL